ncbi:unnamed protein product [Gemmata massiliana]|uniref:Uncharacterized protein n=2 Tax=Gemmata massiliana TaxID=1210884 RepID=A0A6P2CU97_9BACT|nr:unnamed protein product [Gemmata massiliana]
MSIFELLLKRWSKALDDESRLQKLIGWLIKKGIEDQWWEAMEIQPNCHQLRRHFGDWLIEKGDKRGRGYKALGVQQRSGWKLYQKPPKKGTSEYQTWAFNNPNNNRYWNDRFSLPLRWFLKMPLHDGENPKWINGWSHRSLHDRVALAFNELPTEEQEELLSHEQSVFKLSVPNTKAQNSDSITLPKVIQILSSKENSPFPQSVVRRWRLSADRKQVELLVTEVPERPFEEWCKEHKIKFTKETLSSLGSVKSASLSEDWEGRKRTKPLTLLNRSREEI